MEFLLPYLLLINAAGFILMLTDKHKARKNRWRIPEAVLLGTTLIGGSLGILCGMYIARHKTRRNKLAIGVPVILLAQIITLIYLY